MANGNGHHNGYKNGNGMTSVRGNIAKESAGFMLAELASMGTSLGVYSLADQVIPGPVLDYVSKTLGKTCVEPFLDIFEKGMTTFCKLEECQVDDKESREARAERMAKTMIVFGAAYIAAMEVKLHTRRFMNRMTGVIEELPKALPKSATLWEKVKHYGTLKHWTPQEKMIFAADEGVHYLSLYLLNNPMASFTDDMIKATGNMLQSAFGINSRKAHDIATMAWVWEAANGLGMVAGMGAIAGKHAMNWPKPGWLGRPKVAAHEGAQGAGHVEKLMQQRQLAAAAMQTPLPN